MIPVKHVYETTCPRCGRVDKFVTDETSPNLSCGDCLMDAVEVVHLKTKLLKEVGRDAEQ